MWLSTASAAKFSPITWTVRFHKEGIIKTFHTSGNVTTTVGLPGTGIYWTETKRHGMRLDEPTERGGEIKRRENPAATWPISQSVTSEEQTASVMELTPAEINRIYAYCDEPVEWTELISGATAEELFMDREKYDYCMGVAPLILAGNVDAYLNAIEILRPVDDLPCMEATLNSVQMTPERWRWSSA